MKNLGIRVFWTFFITSGPCLLGQERNWTRKRKEKVAVPILLKQTLSLPKQSLWDLTDPTSSEGQGINTPAPDQRPPTPGGGLGSLQSLQGFVLSLLPSAERKRGQTNGSTGMALDIMILSNR